MYSCYCLIMVTSMMNFPLIISTDAIADLNNVVSVTGGTFFSASRTRSHRRHLRRVPLIKIF